MKYLHCAACVNLRQDQELEALMTDDDQFIKLFCMNHKEAMHVATFRVDLTEQQHQIARVCMVCKEPFTGEEHAH